MFALHASRRDLLRTGLVTSSLILAGCADDPTVGSERESDAEDRIANRETVSICGDADTPLVRVPVAYEDDPSRWSVGGSSSCRANSTSDNGDESEGKDEGGTANAEDDE